MNRNPGCISEKIQQNLSITVLYGKVITRRSSKFPEFSEVLTVASALEYT